MDKKNVAPSMRLYDAGGDLRQRWYIELYQDGRRKRIYGGMNALSSASERRALAERLMAEIAAGPAAKPKDQMCAADKMRAALDAKQPALRRKTWQTYKSKIEVWAAWYGRSKDAPGKTSADRFFQHLQDKGAGLTTLNAYRQTLGEFFGLAFPKLPNVFWDRPVHKKTKVPARYFTGKQAAKLKELISKEDPQLWLFIQLMYSMFIRPGELRYLQVGDVLLEEGRVLVRAAISKNKQSQYVAMPAYIQEQVRAWESLPASWYCFSPAGEPGPDTIGMRHMWKRHKVFLERLGLDTAQYKLYSWKHTGAIDAARAGVPAAILQLQLRHHSLDQVAQYLRQMGVDDLADWKDRMPQL